MATAIERRTGCYLLLFLFFAASMFLIDRKVTMWNDRDLDQKIAKVHSQDSLSPWEIAMLEAKELLSEMNDGGAKEDLPSCLVPRKEKTLALVRDVLASNPDSANRTLLPLPLMNVGMPKCGSTTLFGFFDCIGLRTTHWSKNTNDFEGLCMRDAARVGLPPIETCGNNTEAYMEVNIQYPFGRAGWPPEFKTNKRRDECYFPQLSLLEEIHAEDPNVTFIMNFRPVEDWVDSVRNWGKKGFLLTFFQECHLPNLPRGLPKDVHDEKDVLDVMTEFLCSHVQHVRNFVDKYPSHALIELDLYDNMGSKEILSSLFRMTSGDSSSEKCWKHKNKSGKKKKAEQEKRKAAANMNKTGELSGK